ncbi:hypothetical protein Bca101_068285 [Brassica carinata]
MNSKLVVWMDKRSVGEACCTVIEVRSPLFLDPDDRGKSGSLSGYLNSDLILGLPAPTPEDPPAETGVVATGDAAVEPRASPPATESAPSKKKKAGKKRPRDNPSSHEAHDADDKMEAAAPPKKKKNRRSRRITGNLLPGRKRKHEGLGLTVPSIEMVLVLNLLSVSPRLTVQTRRLLRLRLSQRRRQRKLRNQAEWGTLATLRTPSASREVSAVEERGTRSNDNNNNLALVLSDRDPELEVSDPERRAVDTDAPDIPADSQPAGFLSSDTSVDGQEEDRNDEVTEDGEQEGTTDAERIEGVGDPADDDRAGDEDRQTEGREGAEVVSSNPPESVVNEADLPQERTEHSGESLGNSGETRVD